MCRDVAGGMTREASWRAAGFGSRNSTRFFKRPEVAARVAELREEFNKGSAISLAYLQEQLLHLTKADVGNYLEKRPYSDKLRVKDITGLPPELRACISEVTIDKAGTLNFRLHDKTKAIETLLKSIGSIGEAAGVNVLQFNRIERVIVPISSAQTAAALNDADDERRTENGRRILERARAVANVE
jgi:hypothetical protein